MAEKFIPYEKLSKKKKRELNAKRRNTWGSLNPVTRKPASSRAYDRRKARKWIHDEFPTAPFVFEKASAPRRLHPFLLLHDNMSSP